MFKGGITGTYSRIAPYVEGKKEQIIKCIFTVSTVRNKYWINPLLIKSLIYSVCRYLKKATVRVFYAFCSKIRFVEKWQIKWNFLLKGYQEKIIELLVFRKLGTRMLKFTHGLVSPKRRLVKKCKYKNVPLWDTTPLETVEYFLFGKLGREMSKKNVTYRARPTNGV